MLEAAHRGYAYQDLLVATRITDVLLGEIVTATVDKKLVSDDRFDDLTTINLNGGRERAQIKDIGTVIPLAISSFTTEQRNLKLDALVASAVADRDGPGAQAVSNGYRILLRDARPTDPLLLRVLRPAANDPGPFVYGMATVRLRFDAVALWPTGTFDDPVAKAATDAFAFLRNGHLSRSDLIWFCNHTVVEVEAPAATIDMTNPGPAERLLIERAMREVGAGSYPNTDRSPVDVATAFIRTVLAARAGRAKITADELLRRAQLRQDFGAVSRAHPIDLAVEVARLTTTDDVTRNAETAADRAFPLIVIGPPGQGKSWACQRVQDRLAAAGWLVAEHYCFLGDADEDRRARVHADRVIGSLLGRLADADPSIVVEQRPRFAAEDRTLVEAVVRARKRAPDRRVALLVDGLDHVTRVLGATSGQTHPSEVLAGRLAGLGLPAGSVMIVFSQPGEHLQPLREAGALVVDMPGLDRDELRLLAERWHVIEPTALSKSPGSDPQTDATTIEAAKETVFAFLDALVSRSAGNALYATYLCREVLRAPTTAIDPVKTLLSLPTFDGTLASYYEHLSSALGDGKWVADIVALLDFAISRAELREMRPDLTQRIDVALEQLGPVLIERAMQGGIRVYHESFARFWLESMANEPSSILARLTQVSTWLKDKGLFQDSRVFRFLLPTLARSSKLADVVALVGVDFVSRSIAAGFTASAIRANLATAAMCAASVNDWPVVLRCIELSRAADTYEYERLDSTLVEFADVAMALLGSLTFAARLLYDGRTTVPARAGVKLCAQIDAAGTPAPWQEYLDAYDRERKNDNTSYGEDSERQVALAVLRGRLRVAASTPVSQGYPRGSTGLSINLDSLVQYLEDSSLPALPVIDIIYDTLGLTSTLDVVSRLKKPGPYALAVAAKLAASEVTAERDLTLKWATSAVNDEACAGEAHRLIDLGITVDQFQPANIRVARDRLLELTRAVQKDRIQFEPAPVLQWLDACAIAARRDPLGLGASEALLQGEGWYRCWLRFVVALCRAEAQSLAQRPHEALSALKLLTDDLRPFVGDPRACDLYQLQEVITSTFRRVLALLDDTLWSEGTQLLVRVCNEVSTTLSGEMGGPLARDVLLDLVVTGSNQTRYQTSASIVSATLDEGAGRKYYSDIAGFHLAAARLALTSNERPKAIEHWQYASKLLVSYGWHKDITIYELLDSLPALIPLDRYATQKRLEILQPLCERVLFHTDRRETRHARPRWWRLLATADPLGLAMLTAPELLSNCNMPHEELEEARTNLWQEHHTSADPVIAGALRLSIQLGLDTNDAHALDRLSRLVIESQDVVASLLRLLVARADERPIRYSYSNNAELLRADIEQVAEINKVAHKANVPPVLPSSIQYQDKNSDSRPHVHAGTRSDTPIAEFLEAKNPPQFGIGIRGLAKVVNMWRSRPYGAVEGRWTLGRFANAIGYRLLELLDQGRTAEAELAIRTIADGMPSRYDHPLLGDIAEGLERHGFAHQSVLAYTLNWTRSRDHGGWLNFGGRTNIESLRRAAKTDPKTTLNILATEVERLVRGEYGTLGVSQSLILALATLDWGTQTQWPSGQTSVQIAFSGWDEAANVIAERLPRVDSTDDPDLPYVRTNQLSIPSNPIDMALVIATFAGLGHPSREQKRRSLVAIQLLAETHPTLTAEALVLVLAHLAEPATLTWLLAVINELGSNRNILITRCFASLTRLCDSPHLTVRALSRQLLTAVDAVAESPPPFDPIPELIERPSTPIWTPEPDETAGPKIDQKSGLSPDGKDTSSKPHSSNAKKANFILSDAARIRILRAEKLLPRLRPAVIAELVRTLGGEHYNWRLNTQLESLASRAEFRWPDAFIAPYEIAEEVLQRVAGGGRVARALAGEIISDPVAWEYSLALMLLNDPHVPLEFEAIRVPRPELPAPPGHGDAIWQQITTSASHSTTEDVPKLVAAIHDGDRIAATTILDAATKTPTVSEGRYKAWKVIASLETRVSSPRPSWPAKEAITVTRCAAIELRRSHDRAGLKMPPIGNGDLGVWSTTFPHDMTVLSLERTGPLIATDANNGATVDGINGLGYPCTPLAPSYALLQKLGLQPSKRLFQLVDERGDIALAARSWRTNYVVSDYEMDWPTLCGTDLVVRPDIFDRIVAICGSNLAWREYIDGTVRLLTPEADA